MQGVSNNAHNIVATYHRKVVILPAKEIRQKSCTLLILADGFEETSALGFLSALRQAGLCVKSVALTSGLVNSIHGVWVMPDLTMADLDQLIATTSISAVILPEGSQSLAKLTADPRIHRLLRQVAAQRGHIVTSHAGLQVLRVAAVWTAKTEGTFDSQRMSVILREPGQPLRAFAQDLIRRLKLPTRV
jgi:putative intracellular protease/amidase